MAHCVAQPVGGATAGAVAGEMLATAICRNRPLAQWPLLSA
jgi:hypothetical protein